MKMVRRTAGETRMEKGCTVQDLQQLTQALEAVFEDVSVVELPPECEDHWQDDAMQVSYEQGGGQVSCVLRRRVKAGGVSYGIQMSAPLAGNTLPEDRMTERERELVREDLNRDFLTGAYNRRYVETVFRDNLEQLLGKGGQAAAALVSLDNADQLRYTYGQPALDQIVCTIVNQWKKHYDLPGSRVVCRIHGEILLILCEEMTAAQLEEEVAPPSWPPTAGAGKACTTCATSGCAPLQPPAAIRSAPAAPLRTANCKRFLPPGRGLWPGHAGRAAAPPCGHLRNKSLLLVHTRINLGPKGGFFRWNTRETTT